MAVDDWDFKKAIIVQHFAAISEGDNKGFGLDAVNFAYKQEDFDMQDSVVDSVHAHANYDDLDNDIEKYPDMFLRDLAMTRLLFK